MGDKKDTARSWSRYGDDERLERAARELMDFVGECKTEREVVRRLEQMARDAGALPLTSCERLEPGDRLFMNWKGRAFAGIIAGRDVLSSGINFIISHGDAPRVDVKGRPLYEKDNLALLDCHYYGGIKKYQWTNVPLALHGEVHRGGTVFPLVLGEEPGDPVLTFPDLEPHIDREMAERKATETVEGENLDALAGHRPAGDGRGPLDTVAALLKDRFNLDDSTLASADLALVPAGSAREVGFDGAMVGAYGLDDRICAAASWMAWRDLAKAPARTAVFMVMDREEIGSQCVGGADGAFLEQMTLELLRAAGLPTDALTLRNCLSHSVALSADVTSGSNPLYQNHYVRDQQALLGNGTVIVKFSGSRGKYDANEARGEVTAALIEILDRSDIPWQTGSFGQVDKAGGGTLARYVARQGVDTVDVGPALLSMHSPLELASKSDFLALCDCYAAFLQEMKAID